MIIYIFLFNTKNINGTCYQANKVWKLGDLKWEEIVPKFSRTETVTNGEEASCRKSSVSHWRSQNEHKIVTAWNNLKKEKYQLPKRIWNDNTVQILHKFTDTTRIFKRKFNEINIFTNTNHCEICAL